MLTRYDKIAEIHYIIRKNFDTSFRDCLGSGIERNIGPYLRKANQKTD